MSEEPNMPGEQHAEAAAQPEPVFTEPQQAEEQEPRQVPLDALQAVRAEKQALQDELKMMRDHVALVQATQQQPAPKEKNELDGLSKDDVLTVGDLEKILQKKEQKYEMGMQELRMTQKYPDYQQTVTKYLPEVLKQNPGLRDTLLKSQDYELAYYLAKNSDVYKTENKKAKKNADAERIVQNASRAGSLSSVGQASPINEAKRYKSMSDDDFMKQANKNLGYF